MFSKSKRIIGVALAAMMVATSFAGCDDGKPAESGKETSATSATQTKQYTVDEMMADAKIAMGSEGEKGTVNLKVWAPNDAIDQFKANCDDFVNNFKKLGRTIKIEVVAQGEADAATTAITDPDEAADVFGFVSDQAINLFSGGYLQKVRAFYTDGLKDGNLEGAVEACSYKAKDDSEANLYAYPETGDNGYIMFYNKSLITAEEMGSMESILKVCKEKDKKMIINMKDGFYACIVPLTGGGTYSLDDKNNQKLDYDYAKIQPVAKAFADTLANNDAFVSDDVNAVLAGKLMNGTAICGVVGPWKTQSMKVALGDNYAAIKLPTIKVDGVDTQIKSMFGYKMIGVNSKTQYPLTAQSLAYYLSGKKCQEDRAKKLGWGPSFTSLIDSDTVKNDIALNAIYEQQKHSVPQVGLSGSFWDPTGAFGAYLVDKNKDLSDAGIKKAYDEMVTNITTVV